VAMTFAPQAVAHVRRVRNAQRLRGRSARGLRGLGRLAMPVLEGALDRSVQLAAAMDARGYGRTAAVPKARRRATAALVLGGLLAVCAGLYGLLDGQAPAVLGTPMLVLGSVCAAAGLWLGGRRSPRTRYRPDPWALPEWVTGGSGVLAAAAMTVAGLAGADGLRPLPGTAPGLPPLPAAGVLLALAPVLLRGGRA
jgi:energy-coupling factor transport system permease protein